MSAEIPTSITSNELTLLAMESAYTRIFRNAEGSPGFAFVEEPGLTRVISSVPTPWFNSVLCTRLPVAQQDAEIERLVSLYRSRGVPLLWRLGPGSTERASMSAKLRAAGFHPAPSSTAIIGDIPALIHVWEVLPLPVEGVRVSSLAEYRGWFGVFAPTFGVPMEHTPFFERVAERVGFGPEAEVQNLVLRKGGSPVACATTMWRKGEGFASVFNFAVAPELRKTGLGKYMLAYAALRLRKQGARRIGQFSTEVGVPFYLRVSPSERLGVFENWIALP